MVYHSELLETLDAVKKQLQTSHDGIAELSHQHRQWQNSVEAMLSSIQKQETASELRMDPMETLGHGLVHDESCRSLALSSPKKSGHHGHHGRHHGLKLSDSRSERYKKAKHLHSKKISALHPLLQSRKAVQQCPAGPLRKLLSEILPKSEETPPELTVLGQARKCTASIASSSWFEYAAGLVIFLNLVAIGFEAEMTLESEASEFESGFWFAGLERLFLCIYCAEALFRAFSFGWIILCDIWFIVDVFLIVIGMLALLVVPLLASSGMTGFEKFLLVRGLRLLRLMRALRMVRHFKIIWRLVSGFLTAWDTIFASAVLILVTLFIFSCIAIEFIAKDEVLKRSEMTQPVVAEYFLGVGRSMLTLIQFVTLDGLRDVYFPLILERPWLAVYFFSILLVVSMGLLNLITACLVENAMDNAAVTAEEERSLLKQKIRGALPSLIAIFRELDIDGSGLLTHQEVDHVPLEILPPRVLDSVYVDSMRDVFDLLDVNECGFLTQTEFVEGLLNLCLLDMPVATMQNLKLLKIIHDQLLRVERSLARHDVLEDEPASFGV